MTGEVVVGWARREPVEWWDAAIFLAGPTPRDPAVPSWRPAAVELLRERWRGPGRLVVFVPEDPSGGLTGQLTGEVADGSGAGGGWPAQVNWEDWCLNACDVIAFWIPRDLTTLPGLTTNVEWGRWERSGKVVLGSPPEAPATRYLRYYANRCRSPVADTLEDTIDAALAAVGAGARRQGAARQVPLPVWRTEVFQHWYRTQHRAGNSLTEANLLWTFPAGSEVFFWALRVGVHVAAEDRVKDNEVVLARPDVVTVALYRPGSTIDDTRVVLVREFRSASPAPDGYVWELPGGGVEPGADPVAQAALEVAQETGLAIDPGRFRAVACRPVLATMSAHRAHLFSVELTEAELLRLAADGGQAHGVEADGERTYVAVATYRELLGGDRVDWATLGALTQALRTNRGRGRPGDRAPVVDPSPDG